MASSDVTQLLQHWREGNADALDRLMPLVHAELRRVTQHLARTWLQLRLSEENP